jgi:hypothetical protein
VNEALAEWSAVAVLVFVHNLIAVGSNTVLSRQFILLIYNKKFDNF